MTWRELTDKEKSLIRASVRKQCANFAPEYGCLPLDSDCYMTKIGFTNSSLCRYYERSILPMEPEIMSLLSYGRHKMRECKNCGRKFVMNGNRQYCSDRCSLTARRNATARRMRKSREKTEGTM
ncbi:MAG: cysteine-rich VLP protein [Blautia sp.]|nr:cysteine-rich VLP protein [Blautia sp.]